MREYVAEITRGAKTNFQGVNGYPLLKSHSRTTPSRDPEAMWLPFGLNANLRTVSACPSRHATCFPFLEFQTRTALSQHPLAIHRPSMLQARLTTRLVCPSRI